jgi:hypothetical protein
MILVSCMTQCSLMYLNCDTRLLYFHECKHLFLDLIKLLIFYIFLFFYIGNF